MNMGEAAKVPCDYQMPPNGDGPHDSDWPVTPSPLGQTKRRLTTEVMYSIQFTGGPCVRTSSLQLAVASQAHVELRSMNFCDYLHVNLGLKVREQYPHLRYCRHAAAEREPCPVPRKDRERGRAREAKVSHFRPSFGEFCLLTSSG